MGRVLPWVAGAFALVIAAFGWYRTLTFSAVTGPQLVQWYAADGSPIEAASHGYPLGDGMMTDPIILGDRLIVRSSAPDGGKGGFAWISPARGEARIAWPTEGQDTIAGVAVRDVQTFALVVEGYSGEADNRKQSMEVAIAGPDGWLRAPTTIGTWAVKSAGQPLLLGMSFVGNDLEVVLTHPVGEDVFGSSSPVDIIRISATGVPVVRSQGIGCLKGCWVLGAVPTEKGWTLVVRTLEERTTGPALVDASGTSVPAPASMQIWETGMLDRTALGTKWGESGWGENRIERDGTLGKVITSPIPGWTAIASFSRLAWIDGVLRRERLWGKTQTNIDMLAQRAAGRTIVTQSIAQDVQLVGASPETLEPTIYNSTSYDFRIGAFLPRSGGGYYWVTGSGEYVTLDDQLKRTDPLSLRHHLRTRGSVGDFIDEGEHEKFLAWVLFGLPILLLVALAFSLREKQRRAHYLGVASILYVIPAGICLLKVLPLL